METCNLEPFRYQATPVPNDEAGMAGSSGNQINEQSLEDYISRLIRAVCTDLQVIETRLEAIEARLTALEEA